MKKDQQARLFNRWTRTCTEKAKWFLCQRPKRNLHQTTVYYELLKSFVLPGKKIKEVRSTHRSPPPPGFGGGNDHGLANLFFHLRRDFKLWIPLNIGERMQSSWWKCTKTLKVEGSSYRAKSLLPTLVFECQDPLSFKFNLQKQQV